MNNQPPSKWTPSLAIRVTIYLCVVVPLLGAVPEVRHGIAYIFMQIAIVGALIVGALFALMLLTRVKHR